MKEYICEVVPVYVRPQPITDEKAYVGVIVRCPGNGFSDYRLIGEGDPALNRVANFFPRFGRENLLRTLEWSRHDIEFFPFRREQGDCRTAFRQSHPPPRKRHPIRCAANPRLGRIAFIRCASTNIGTTRSTANTAAPPATTVAASTRPRASIATAQAATSASGAVPPSPRVAASTLPPANTRSKVHTTRI